MLVIGGLPEPSGGVTNFIFRLAHHFRDCVDEIVDLYPHENKWSVAGLKHPVRPRGAVKAIVWLTGVFFKAGRSDAYFNFSSYKILYIVPFLPKRRSRLWILTLHHGKLMDDRRQPPFARLLKIALRKFDRIGVIGSRQTEFYKNLDVPRGKMISIIPYLPYVPPPPEFAGDLAAVGKRIEAIASGAGKIVLASGYPTSIYQHEWLVEYAAREQVVPYTMVLCLYGKDSENRLEWFRQAAVATPRLHLFEGLAPDGFQRVLAAADVYVRPTLVDSFGVAVAEAQALGVPVIASDACDRPDGVSVFPRNDKQAFFALLDQSLQGDERMVRSNDGNLDAVRRLLCANR